MCMCVSVHLLGGGGEKKLGGKDLKEGVFTDGREVG